MKSIGIQKGLTPIKEYLENEGYRVQEIDLSQKQNNSLDKFDAIVVTGANEDRMGIQATRTKTPIIEASGMSPEDIKSSIESRGQA
jgi:peptidase E